MGIAVFGGSFNPPHLGHNVAVQAAMDYLKPRIFYIIPAGNPPHKTLHPGTPSETERLLINHLAWDEVPGVTVSDIELRREGPSYTYDTIAALKKEHGEEDIFLLIGFDLLADFDKWYRCEDLVKECILAVFTRNFGEDEELREFCRDLERRFGATIVQIPKPTLEISSSEIRSMLPERRGKTFMEDAAYARLIKMRHYGAKPDPDWLWDKVRPYLDEKRIPHVEGCREEARRLASLYGADIGDAEEAAILHDITKKESHENQLKICEENGIMTDTLEQENEKLLHSKTGAYLSRELFGVPDEIFGAIYWHTTGRANMTLLEKIIYIADYIEPTRSFDRVEELRSLAYEDIDEAMIMGLRMSLEEIRERGTTPHGRTVEALEFFLSQRER